MPGHDDHQYGIRTTSGLILLYDQEGEARRALKDVPDAVMLLRRKITYGQWEDKLGVEGENWHWKREDWRRPHAF